VRWGCTAGGGPEPGHDIDRVFGQTRLERQFGQAQRAQRALLRRLEHHRVAAGERRRQLPGRHQQGEVPRHDRADHADGLARDGRQDVVRGGRGLAVELVDRLGVPAEGARHRWHIHAAGIGNGLAHVERFQQGKLRAVGVDEIGEALEHGLARLGRHARPAALLEGGAGGAYRVFDVLAVALGDAGEQRPGRRIDAVECAPR
jgi:hypothetical protein